jgi:hypothetical protein
MSTKRPKEKVIWTKKSPGNVHVFKASVGDEDAENVVVFLQIVRGVELLWLNMYVKTVKVMR